MPVAGAVQLKPVKWTGKDENNDLLKKAAIR
jgi:hypothetical protein